MRWLAAIHAELARLRAAETDHRAVQRRKDDTSRKRLAGEAVLNRAIRRGALLRWLRSRLDSGLTRAADRARFNLQNNGPLIPEEDWPGWPVRGSGAPAADSGSPMSPVQRRARIAVLENRRKAIAAELHQLLEQDATEREARNTARKILVGAVLLALSLTNPRVARWLRKLLADSYTEARDRKLFRLDEGGPLVREEDQAGLRPTPRKAVKRRAANGRRAAGEAADAPAPLRLFSGPPPAGRARSSTATLRIPDPESEGNDAEKSGVQEPIPGWRPCRIRVPRASDSKATKAEWGALLEGKAAVAALPEHLLGRTITVTDSEERSWPCTITEVVSRGDRSCRVRRTGRPDPG